MTFLPRSRVRIAALLTGAVIVLLASAAWAYYEGIGRVATLAATEGLSGPQASAIFTDLRNSLLGFMVAVGFLLVAVIILALEGDETRRKNQKRLVHWMKHRGCPVDEELDLVRPDEGMERIVGMIEAMFPRTEEDPGGPRSHREHVEELKTRFIEIITHQLQTPLTSIRWNLEALLREELGKLNAKQKELLNITDKNYGDILVMISDWVEALDVERGFLRMHMEPLDLRKYVDLVTDDLESQAALKNIDVDVKFSRGLPQVRADKSKLLFVLKKLVHNAITYTPEHGDVKVHARKEGDYVRIDVEDSGVGIPYDEQQHIFKKFFRASNAALIEPNASGVGLFVAKTMVEAFGGSIGFDSTEGKGTTFSFTLPAVPRKKSRSSKKK